MPLKWHRERTAVEDPEGSRPHGAPGTVTGSVLFCPYGPAGTGRGGDRARTAGRLTADVPRGQRRAAASTA
ncbi:hypothetical protein GCM10009549_51540 [Streptomyces thermoalcalitolerans]|uniref:Uncharacterized protein n=1 Tax=Streptomyces thermoalcalitolerans TaxID=65605 RepID=A0ABN1PJV0_9ACTN